MTENKLQVVDEAKELTFLSLLGNIYRRPEVWLALEGMFLLFLSYLVTYPQPDYEWKDKILSDSGIALLGIAFVVFGWRQSRQIRKKK